MTEIQIVRLTERFFRVILGFGVKGSQSLSNSLQKKVLFLTVGELLEDVLLPSERVFEDLLGNVVLHRGLFNGRGRLSREEGRDGDRIGGPALVPGLVVLHNRRNRR